MVNTTDACCSVWLRIAALIDCIISDRGRIVLFCVAWGGFFVRTAPQRGASFPQSSIGRVVLGSNGDDKLRARAASVLALLLRSVRENETGGCAIIKLWRVGGMSG